MPAILPTILAAIVAIGFLGERAHAEAVKLSPRLTVFTDDQAKTPDSRPTVLRGSATQRGTVARGDDRRFDLTERFQIGAGPVLWLTDPETGEVIACRTGRTSTVGSRFIDCLEGELPSSAYD